MKRISELTNDITSLKSEVKDLTHTLAGKDFEIRSMQDRVKEAESIMKEEQQKCKDRIKQIEDDFLTKEKHLYDKLKRDMN